MRKPHSSPRDALSLEELEGRQYPAVTYQVEREKIREFARAIGDPHYESGDIAPPTFAALYALAPLGQVLADPDVAPYATRVIHAEQELAWSRPVRAGDVLSTTGKIERIRRRGDSWFINISTSTTDAGGQSVASAAATLLVGG